jgi:hypothetical protein
VRRLNGCFSPDRAMAANPRRRGRRSCSTPRSRLARVLSVSCHSQTIAYTGELDGLPFSNRVGRSPRRAARAGKQSTLSACYSSVSRDRDAPDLPADLCPTRALVHEAVQITSLYRRESWMEMFRIACRLAVAS